MFRRGGLAQGSLRQRKRAFFPPLTINDILYICLGSNNPPDVAELFVKRHHEAKITQEAMLNALDSLTMSR